MAMTILRPSESGQDSKRINTGEAKRLIEQL
jgi:hypothetical protein